ncbi:MAG: glucose-6-phosphate isomerase, partial [Chitinophagaceae bacterium]
MLPAVNPTKTNAWTKLKQHAEKMKSVHMRTLFEQDPDRFSKFSSCAEDMVFDFSKNIITEETLDLLFSLAKEC